MKKGWESIESQLHDYVIQLPMNVWNVNLPGWNSCSTIAKPTYGWIECEITYFMSCFNWQTCNIFTGIQSESSRPWLTQELITSDSFNIPLSPGSWISILTKFIQILSTKQAQIIACAAIKVIYYAPIAGDEYYSSTHLNSYFTIKN